MDEGVRTPRAANSPCAQADLDSETIGGRLAAIVRRIPDAVAITERGAGATFAQLDASASAFARAIEAVAGSSSRLVCLLFESKIPAVGAVLGAARCGRAYVPLDAGDPDERLRFIVEDSEPVALIAEGALLARARALAPDGCAIIDASRVESSEGPRFADVSPDALAYVLYTSGSTGRPKGVMQTHRNVLFFADAFAKTLRLSGDDRMTFLFSLSFGASTMSIFGGMLHGATMCAYDVRRDGIAGLADWLDRERISVFHAVPTVFRELMAGLPAGRRLAQLRAIDLGGEALFDGDIERFKAHTAEHCIFVNHLAATEAHVIAQQVFDHRSPPTGGILPAGRSPEGLRVLIRRDDRSEANRNEVGELVIASPYVSTGYWRRPELTAAAFAPDPALPRSRCYATGDLGRIDGDGLLHFLGRRGSRVKIRGHTVDLAEVEAGLAACAGVKKAAVVAAEADDPAAPVRLIAYIAAASEADRRAALMRRRLARHVPSYMLPSAYAFVDALPLTAGGKIDRKALAALPAPDPIQAREFEAPRDVLERAIARIFEKLLKAAPIGRDDDFFMLGGDSLSVAELQERLRDAFGADLANPAEGATVAQIAEEIRRRRAAG